jgi:hypothetical protein
MNRKSVGVVVLGVGFAAGLIGFLTGLEVATSRWRNQLPELGKVIARTNSGVQLRAEDWPDDIRLISAGTQDDSLTVYMGVAVDIDVDLTFEADQLVSISCR